MMHALHLVSFVAGVAGFVFILLSIASGLLYIAEVIEEHSALAKSIGQRINYAIILFLVVLYFVDGLPIHLAALGILCHVVYLQNFRRTWPSISLTSVPFIASCILVVLFHFFSFTYFTQRSRGLPGGGLRSTYSGYGASRVPAGSRWKANSRPDDTFLDVATYFGLCVWFMPFYLFLSLSANDNVLPSSAGLDQSTAAARDMIPPPRARKHSSMLKAALSTVFSFVPSSLAGRRSIAREGLIASPSQNFGSRPPSPPYGVNGVGGDYIAHSPFHGGPGSRNHSRTNSRSNSFHLPPPPSPSHIPPPPASPGFHASLDPMRRSSFGSQSRLNLPMRSVTEPGGQFPTLNSLQNQQPYTPRAGAGVPGSLGRPGFNVLQKRLSSMKLAPLDFSSLNVATGEGGEGEEALVLDSPAISRSPLASGLVQRRAHE